MATYKTIPDLDKITAVEISTKANYSVEIGQNTDSNKESKGMNLDELESLIGGEAGSSIEDSGSTTGLYTEETANRLVGHSANTGTDLIFEMFEGTGTPVSVFQIDGNGDLFNNGEVVLKYIKNSTNRSIFIGTKSGPAARTGNNSVFIGHLSGVWSQAAHNNVCLGYYSGGNLLDDNNVMIGYETGKVSQNVLNNTFIGYRTGLTNSSGSYNVYIGSNAGKYSTSSNTLIIDNQDRTNAATELTDSLIVGEFNATKASQWLQINGVLKTYGRQPYLQTQIALVSPATYNITDIDETILLQGKTATMTATLPSITSSNHGKRYTIKCTDATNTVTLQTDGSDTLDEAAATSETLNLNDKRIYIADNDSSKWIKLN